MYQANIMVIFTCMDKSWDGQELERDYDEFVKEDDFFWKASGNGEWNEMEYDDIGMRDTEGKEEHEAETRFQFDPVAIAHQLHCILPEDIKETDDIVRPVGLESFPESETQEDMDEDIDDISEIGEFDKDLDTQDDLMMDEEFFFKKKRRKGKRGRRPIKSYGLGSSGEEDNVDSEDDIIIPKTKISSKSSRKRKTTIPLLSREQSRLMGRANQAYVYRNYSEAIDLYQELLSQVPHAFEIYNYLSLIAQEQGDTLTSLRYSLLAAYLSKCDDINLWLDLARRAATLFPDHSADKEAIFAYSKILRYDRRNVEALWMRACLSMRHYQCNARMLETCTLLLGIYPQNPFLLRLRIHYSVYKGSSLEAIQWLESSLLSHPPTVSFYQIRCLIRLYRYIGSHDRMLKALPNLLFWIQQRYLGLKSDKDLDAITEFDFVQNCPPDVLYRFLERIHTLRTPLDDLSDPDRLLDPVFISKESLPKSDLLENHIKRDIFVSSEQLSGNPYEFPEAWFDILPLDLQVSVLSSMVHTVRSAEAQQFIPIIIDWLTNRACFSDSPGKFELMLQIGIDIGKHLLLEPFPCFSSSPTAFMYYSLLLGHVKNLDLAESHVLILLYMGISAFDIETTEKYLLEAEKLCQSEHFSDTVLKNDAFMALAEFYAKSNRKDLSVKYADQISHIPITLSNNSTQLDFLNHSRPSDHKRRRPKTLAASTTGQTGILGAYTQQQSVIHPKEFFHGSAPMLMKMPSQHIEYSYIRYSDQQCNYMRMVLRRSIISSDGHKNYKTLESLSHSLGYLVMDFLHNGYFYPIKYSHTKPEQAQSVIARDPEAHVIGRALATNIDITNQTMTAISKNTQSLDQDASAQASNQALSQAMHGLELNDWYSTITMFCLHAASLGAPLNQIYYVIFQAAHCNLFCSRERYRLGLYFLALYIGRSRRSTLFKSADVLRVSVTPDQFVEHTFKATSKIFRLLWYHYQEPTNFGIVFRLSWLALSRSDMSPLLLYSRQYSSTHNNVNCIPKGWAERIFATNTASMIRAPKTFPTGISRLVFLGHTHLSSHSLGDALACYEQALSQLLEIPTPSAVIKDSIALLLLLVGICQLQRSLQRNCTNRQYQFLQSFSTMRRYAEEQNWSKEAFYNLGRWMDHCGLSRYAIYYYEKVLYYNPNSKHGLLEYQAAYNLSLLYSRVGNPLLASYYMNKYANVYDLYTYSSSL
jgi:tetratricopeptide (TPR) repeat protein